jgi:hypothetical protein
MMLHTAQFSDLDIMIIVAFSLLADCQYFNRSDEARGFHFILRVATG